MPLRLEETALKLPDNTNKTIILKFDYFLGLATAAPRLRLFLIFVAVAASTNECDATKSSALKRVIGLLLRTQTVWRYLGSTIMTKLGFLHPDLGLFYLSHLLFDRIGCLDARITNSLLNILKTPTLDTVCLPKSQ